MPVISHELRFVCVDAPTTEQGTVIDLSMAEYEPASGYNLPPGCFDDDIEREFGGERRYCSECRHCIESDTLDCCVCGPKLAEAVAKLKGTQRWSPRYFIAAVEDAFTYEDDCCPEFEE